MKLTKILAFFICISSCSLPSLTSALKDANRQCELKNPNWKGITGHKLRMQLLQQGNLDFFKQNFDTIYLLESYNVESGAHYGSVFNQRNIYSYRFHNNSFSFQEDAYPKEMIRQVRQWDTTAIKKDAENFRVLPATLVTATRIVRLEKGTKVDCISFREYDKM